MINFTHLLAISGGAIVGANCRYLVQVWANSLSEETYKFGTFAVNMSGALVMGILVAALARFRLSEPVVLMLTVGILGSYTTFSAFSIENLRLLQDRQFGYLLFNAIGSVVFGIALVYIGVLIGNRIFNASA